MEELLAGRQGFAETVQGLTDVYEQRPGYQQLGVSLGSAVLSGPFTGPKAALRAQQGLARGAEGIGRLAANVAKSEAGGFISVSNRSLARLAPSQVHVPPPQTAAVWGFKPIQTGLTRLQRTQNVVREAFGSFGPGMLSEYVEPASKARLERTEAVGNIAAAFGAQTGAKVRTAFRLNDSGQVLSLAGVDPSLPGSPTIQDIAARLPRFQARLTSAQKAVLGEIKAAIDEMDGAFQSVGLERHTRADVMDGGFYIPRGFAEDSSIDMPKAIRGTGTMGKAGFEKAARYDSMAHALNDGFEYAPIEDTLSQYARQSGARTIDQDIANYYKSLIDPDTGKPFAESPSNRLPPGLSQAIKRVRNQTRGTRISLIKAQTRARSAERQSKREFKELDASNDRVQSAAQREAARKAAQPTKDDFKFVRGELRAAMDDAQHISATMARIRSDTLAAGRKVDADDARVYGLIDELDQLWAEGQTVIGGTLGRVVSGQSGVVRGGQAELIGEGFENADVSPDILETLVRQYDEAQDKISRKVDAILDSDRYESINVRYEELLEKGDATRTTLATARQEIAAGHKMEREMFNADAQFRLAHRELRMLEREMRRQGTDVKRAGTRLANAQAREGGLEQRYDQLRDQLRDVEATWKHEQALARQTPRDQGMIRLPRGELTGVTFPLEIANRANKLLEKQAPTTGMGADTIRAVNAYNNLYRVLNATLDISAPAIQGAIIAGTDPKLAARAAKFSIDSMGDPQILGMFLNEKDVINAAEGLPVTRDMARWGLHFGGATSEFSMQPGVFEKIGQIPLIKETNRAFGYWGDYVRHETFIEEVKMALDQGKTIPQMIANGEMEQIASAVNRMTGYSPNKAFGSLGDLILFAPRFLASRMEFLASAARGLAPGATAEQAIARRRMLYFIGNMSTLTVAANAARGKETEFNLLMENPDGGLPIVNPNFMRIKDFAGRDWSLFGPWDSLLKLIVNTAMGRPNDALRSMSSGVVQHAWDTVTGENAIGEPTTGLRFWEDPQGFAAYLIESYLPFSVEQIPEGLRHPAGMEPLNALGTLVSSGLGIKASLTSPSEDLADARRVVMGERNILDGLRGEPQSAVDHVRAFLTRGEPLDPGKVPSNVIAQIDADPRVQAAKRRVEESRRLRNSGYQKYLDAVTKVDDEIDTTIKARAAALQSGSISPKAFREQLSSLNSDRHAQKEKVRDIYAEDIAFFDDLPKNETPFNVAHDDYWAILESGAPLENPETGEFDYNEQKRRIAQWAAKWPEDLVNEVNAHLQTNKTPIEQKLQDDRAFLEQYWGVVDVVLADWGKSLPSIKRLYDQYRRTDPRDQALFRKANPTLDAMLGLVDDIKAGMRARGDPEIERKLLWWGYISSPTNPIVVRENDIRQSGKLQSGSIPVEAR
ncbi:MAG: hypothetical protein O2854_03860 [Chloroflexi bacterium]|nr:hypothetical protein [Chloroflexota bacterium]